MAVVFYNKEIFEKYKPTPFEDPGRVAPCDQRAEIEQHRALSLANKNNDLAHGYMYLVDREGGSDVVRRAVMEGQAAVSADPAFVEAEPAW